MMQSAPLADRHVRAIPFARSGRFLCLKLSPYLLFYLAAPRFCFFQRFVRRRMKAWILCSKKFKKKKLILFSTKPSIQNNNNKQEVSANKYQGRT